MSKKQYALPWVANVSVRVPRPIALLIEKTDGASIYLKPEGAVSVGEATELCNSFVSALTVPPPAGEVTVKPLSATDPQFPTGAIENGRILIANERWAEVTVCFEYMAEYLTRQPLYAAPPAGGMPEGWPVVYRYRYVYSGGKSSRWTYTQSRMESKPASETRAAVEAQPLYAASPQPSVASPVAWEVKPLEWAKSTIEPWSGDYHSLEATGYTVRCVDENGWRWQGYGAHGYERSPEAAQAAAQAHHEARIRSALIPSPIASAPVGIEAKESRKALDLLIELAGATWSLMDGSVTDDDAGVVCIEPQDHAVVSEIFDRMDELPDDQPGYVMGPTAKAAWALRALQSPAADDLAGHPLRDKLLTHGAIQALIGASATGAQPVVSQRAAFEAGWTARDDADPAVRLGSEARDDAWAGFATDATDATGAQIEVDIVSFTLSGNRKEHYVRIKCGDRYTEVRKYSDAYLNRARYEADTLRHVLLGHPKPDLMAPEYADPPEPPATGAQDAEKVDERAAVAADINEAIELLQEKRYGNPARSPGHNAQIVLKRALAALKREG